MVQAHKVALDVKFGDEGGAGVVRGGLTEVAGEALLAVEGAFALAAGVGIGDEAAVPPVGADVEEEMMDDAVAEGGGDDFAGDGVLDDEGDAAAGMIITAEDAVAEVNEVFHIVKFKAVLVYGVFLAFAGGEVG